MFLFLLLQLHLWHLEHKLWDYLQDLWRDIPRAAARQGFLVTLLGGSDGVGLSSDSPRCCKLKLVPSTEGFGGCNVIPG